MGNAIFQRLPAPEPLNRFSKNFAQLITPVTPRHIQIFGSVSLKVCLRMREIVIVRRLFLSFMLIATLQVRRPPVGSIIAVNGLNDAFWWHSHSLYGLVKKNWNLPLLAPKIWKFALWAMAALKSHNSGIVKDTCKMFVSCTGFSGSGNQMVLLDPPCCHDNKWMSFGHKIGYYSACIRDITKILAPNRGFSGSTNLIV